MVKYAGEVRDDSEAGDVCKSFLTVIRSSNMGLKYWREWLVESYVVFKRMGMVATARSEMLCLRLVLHIGGFVGVCSGQMRKLKLKLKF